MKRWSWESREVKASPRTELERRELSRRESREQQGIAPIQQRTDQSTTVRKLFEGGKRAIKTIKVPDTHKGPGIVPVFTIQSEKTPSQGIEYSGRSCFSSTE